MTLLTIALVLVSLPLVFALAYVPAVALRRVRPFRDVPLDGWPTVSVLVPARNEAAVIASKLGNFRAFDYPSEKLELLVGSDVSDDGTDALVETEARRDPRIRLVRMPARTGKAGVLNRLVSEARHEVVVFSDASALLDPGVLRSLVRGLSDPSVGVVTASYEPRAEGGFTRLYWAIERRLRVLESTRDVLVGVHGACAALRRAEVPSLPTDQVNDDYVLGMLVRAAGKRVRYVPGARVTEAIAPVSTVVRARRRRILAGNVQMLRAAPRLLGNARRLYPWILAHKLPRTLAPLVQVPGLVLAVAGAAAGAVQLSGLGRAGLFAVLLALSPVFAAAGLLVASLTAGLIEGLRRPVGPATWETGLAAGIVVPRSVAFVKRCVDLLGATVGLTLFAPVMAACAVAIRVSSKGPVVFRQERVGLGEAGRETTFEMLKFRTMRVDAEAASGPVWASGDDPRVTRVGKVLRKLRLDELPQLWNVLRGDMSLVGPRPERPFFCEKLRTQIPLYDDRLLGLKPGITGYAQIHSGYDVDLSSVRRKILWDLAYAARLTSVRRYLAAEAAIVVETVVVMITGRGAH